MKEEGLSKKSSMESSSSGEEDNDEKAFTKKMSILS
jgi:hypothetical protein